MTMPTMKNLPPGVREVDTGDAQLANELKASFGLAMGTGIMMVFAVLVLLFARVFQPLTILSALPLSVGGAAVALLLTHLSLSLSVIIGFLMLMGHRGQELDPAGGLRHRGRCASASIGPRH